MEVKRAIPRDAEPDQREKNTKMFLGGLNRNTTEDTIKRYFETNFDCVVDSVDLIYEKRDMLQPGQEPKPRFALLALPTGIHLPGKILLLIMYSTFTSLVNLASIERLQQKIYLF